MNIRSCLLVVLVLLSPLAAHAHRVFILPTATVLSGESPVVSFDAAVSNDIFYYNHRPLRLKGIEVISPNGDALEIENAHSGELRSVFDLKLSQEGTYKVSMASAGLRARWETAEGKRGSWPARGETPAPGDFEKSVPKKAKNLEVSFSSRRVETFVTAGAPTDSVLTPTGKGLEMKPLTHPNDLYAGETAKFQFLIDGKLAKGATVTLIKDGGRYQNAPEELQFTSDKKGLISITWPTAGRYWLEAEYSDKKAKAPAKTRKGTYVLTLEVLPQ